MRFPPWYHRSVEIDDDEEVLFTHSCSSAARDRPRSLVGGDVHVTSHHVVFTPNALAATVGRRPWVHRISELSGTRMETVTLGRVWGPQPALRLLIAEGTRPAFQRTVIMTTHDHVGELAASIERARHLD
jgi:hypothetical protein